MRKTKIVVVGAGAAGLLAALDLARAGNEVTILEARCRAGGRIYSLDPDEFGYPAQGGAEFVHGPAPLTREIAEEAGMTLSPRRGEVWNVRGDAITQDGGIVGWMAAVSEKLIALERDMTIAEFLTTYFGGKAHAELRRAVERMVEGYDAADPRLASTFGLRDEWMFDGFGETLKIKEGYGALIRFLETQCRESGVGIRLNRKVTRIEIRDGKARLDCADGEAHEAHKVVVTVPLPLITEIDYLPAQPEKIAAARNIGFGGVIKFLLKFKTRWWIGAQGQDLSRMFILRTRERIPVWWTQYPLESPVLTGWLSGPKAQTYFEAPPQDVLAMALASLAKSFGTSVQALKDELVASKIVDWPADPNARGAYSYATLATKAARQELRRPVDGILFFAGEGLYTGKEAGTVEAALASGREAARAVAIAADNQAAYSGVMRTEG